MFNRARFTLTAWYLLIIMAISITFSMVIYKVLSNELVRFERVQRFRIESRIFQQREIPVSLELVDEIKQRIKFRLILVNFSILFISGGLGYFLAGRTLSPIKEMVDEQNRFISDASHELRTPLTSLKSALEVHLRDKNLTLNDAKKMIAENIKDVNKLDKLTDSLLELSRFQNTVPIYSFEKLKINNLAKEAIRKVTPLARKKKIKIYNETTNLEIDGLKQELTEMLVILLDNAIKYSPENKSIKITSRKTDGNILITVSDQGYGIAKKDLSFIFDRFFRSEQGRSKAQAGGYGLGLSIAKKIVSLHNGKIKVESKLNQGSVFTLILPIKQ